MSTRTLVTLFALSLLALTGCSREKSDWRSAQAADSSESYEQFIATHPDSTLVANARERLVQLSEEKDWRSAAEADTRESYQQFLAQYPAGKWAKEAQVRIDNFATSGASSAAIAVTPSGASAGDAGTATAAAAGSATPEVPPVAPADAAGSAGPYGVQLGAFSTAERANEEWTKLAAQTKGTLDGLAPRVVVGSAGGKTIYRLQAEVRDEVQARAVCGGLKAVAKPCVVVLPPAH